MYEQNRTDGNMCTEQLISADFTYYLLIINYQVAMMINWMYILIFFMSILSF